uniref:Uncharacterized protein n=1 Tax=Octopus bimaculoides TaxID=37653 RepID=A0A0L8HSW9_OCTBM
MQNRNGNDVHRRKELWIFSMLDLPSYELIPVTVKTVLITKILFLHLLKKLFLKPA